MARRLTKNHLKAGEKPFQKPFKSLGLIENLRNLDDIDLVLIRVTSEPLILAELIRKAKSKNRKISQPAIELIENIVHKIVNKLLLHMISADAIQAYETLRQIEMAGVDIYSFISNQIHSLHEVLLKYRRNNDLVIKHISYLLVNYYLRKKKEERLLSLIDKIDSNVAKELLESFAKRMQQPLERSSIELILESLQAFNFHKSHQPGYTLVLKASLKYRENRAMVEEILLNQLTSEETDKGKAIHVLFQLNLVSDSNVDLMITNIVTRVIHSDWMARHSGFNTVIYERVIKDLADLMAGVKERDLLEVA
ncbi:MAG: hypothetical protein Q7S22_00385 [Candidatus Micrarchaeota archaeon]|nr:hypothetical protein [Candidatus Micrarchaeota archaeon]